MNVARFEVGFIEFPNKTMLNIFAVGCGCNCSGCCNEKLKKFDYEPKFQLSNEMFLDKLNESEGLIDGVCWLGGDATFQKERLIELSVLLKRNFPELLNVLYTGRYFEQLDKEIKQNVNVIVDGPFEGYTIKDENTNQRIFIKYEIKKQDWWKQVNHEQLQSQEVLKWLSN